MMYSLGEYSPYSQNVILKPNNLGVFNPGLTLREMDGFPKIIYLIGGCSGTTKKHIGKWVEA